MFWPAAVGKFVGDVEGIFTQKHVLGCILGVCSVKHLLNYQKVPPAADIFSRSGNVISWRV